MEVTEQLLCSIGDAAALLGIGRSKFYGMLSSGLIGPSPVLLAGKRMFNVDELRRWCKSSCVNREQWQAVKESKC